MSERIIVPYKPRNWALRLHRSYRRWAALVLHRRAGKTTAILNHHQRAALDDGWESARLRHILPAITDSEVATLLKRRTYWHVMPTFAQGKLTGAWDTLKEISKPIPGIKPNESNMSILYPNGNRLQILGAAEPDSLRGPALSGLSLDEYSQIPSNAFSEVLSKALADHVGYCIFSGTIKGADQLYETYQAAKDDPEWFALWQDVNVSLDTEEGATITALAQAMKDERALVLKGLMTQAEFDQEWFLAPEAAIKGSIYGEQITKLRESGHITRVPYDPSLPVDTDWDLGLDAMAVWFSQRVRTGEVRIIDYYEDVGGGMVEAIRALKGQQTNTLNDEAVSAANRRRSEYVYGEHWGPHDIDTGEISSSLTRKQYAISLGVRFNTTPKIGVEEGIAMARLLLPRCWFDEANCKDGLNALRHYHKKWEQRLSQFSAKPEHDWASHGSDAFRGLSVRYKLPEQKAAEARRCVPLTTAWS